MVCIHLRAPGFLASDPGDLLGPLLLERSLHGSQGDDPLRNGVGRVAADALWGHACPAGEASDNRETSCDHKMMYCMAMHSVVSLRIRLFMFQAGWRA